MRACGHAQTNHMCEQVAVDLILMKAGIEGKAVLIKGDIVARASAKVSLNAGEQSMLEVAARQGPAPPPPPPPKKHSNSRRGLTSL